MTGSCPAPRRPAASGACALRPRSPAARAGAGWSLRRGGFLQVFASLRHLPPSAQMSRSRKLSWLHPRAQFSFPAPPNSLSQSYTLTHKRSHSHAHTLTHTVTHASLTHLHAHTRSHAGTFYSALPPLTYGRCRLPHKNETSEGGASPPTGSRGHPGPGAPGDCCDPGLCSRCVFPRSEIRFLKNCPYRSVLPAFLGVFQRRFSPGAWCSCISASSLPALWSENQNQGHLSGKMPRAEKPVPSHK